MIGNYNVDMSPIAQGLNMRAANIENEKKRQQELEIKKLVSKSIPTLREGSYMRQLFEADPQTGAFLAKTLNIPLDNLSDMEQFSQNVRTIAGVASKDPAGAVQIAQKLRDDRAQIGLNTDQYDKFLQTYQENPDMAIRALNVMDETLNKDLIEAQQLEQRKMKLQERGLDLQERRIDADMQQGQRQYASHFVQTAGGLVAVNPATNQATKVTVDGEPIIAGQYDPNLKRGLSEAGATGAAVGKDTATAITSVSQVEDNANLLRQKVNAVLKHPGRDIATGASSVIPVIPGTKQADFVNRFEQLQGDAFLQAFESLKGGGQITEIEGNKAQQAINRMNRGTTKEEFDAAAKDFLSVVDALEKRTKAKAGKEQDQAPSFTGQDKQAYDWAVSNPNDPRSQAILQRLGVQ